MAVMFSRGDKLEQGHYTIIKELGVGGMGVVYLCRDEQLMRDVAIKMLLPELMADKSNVDVFIQEARLAAQLEHPNIVTVFDIKVEERSKKMHHYVCMEYLPGGNLANRVVSGPLAVEHCLNWMKQLASGLTFAHKRGVVHQDIKADNIFITTEGDLKIGDFGLAKLLVGRVHYKSANKGMGTPAYMSPELCHGDPQDHRSDIYSLGVLFFEMATGQLPFRARGMIEMATKHTSAPIPSSKRLNPLVPEILDKVIRRMMAKTPQERYTSMSEVLTILDDLIFELRVARLGLSGRPLLRSGPVNLDPQLQKYLGQHAPPEGTPAKNVADSVAAESAAVEARAREQSGPSSPNRTRRQSSEDIIAELESPQHKQPAAHPAQEILKPLARPPVQPAIVPPPVAKTDADSGGTAPPKLTSGASVMPKRSPSIAGDSLLAPTWSFKSQGPLGWGTSSVIDRDERTMYCTSFDGKVYAIETASGKEIWRFDSRAPIVAAPVLHQNTLFVVGSAGDVFSLGTQEGSINWRKNFGTELYANATMSKDLLFVASAKGTVLSLHMDDGTMKWQRKLDHAIIASPQKHGELIIAGTTHGDLYGLSVGDGSVSWKFGASGSIVAAATSSVDSVYFGTTAGIFYAIEAASGGLIWEYQTSKPIVSRAAIAFSSVIFPSQDKWLYCCERYDGGLNWKSALRSRMFAAPILHRDLILAAGRDGWLQAFSTRNGELKWQKHCQRQIEATPHVVQNQLLMGTVEGEMVAFALPA